MSVEDERKLFVAGLPETTTENGLRELFESTGGNVDELTVPRDRATGRVRGFAFLTMGSREQADKARQELDGSLQEGRSISVREFRGDRSAAPAPRPSSPPQDAEESTLYVGNLPFDTTTTELEGLFGEAGFDQVKRIHLPQDPEGRARGFGFVTLDSADSARGAVDDMAGVALRGRALSISVARARGKGPPPGGRPSRPPGGGPPSNRPPGPRPSRPPRDDGFGGGAGGPPPDAPFFQPPPPDFSAGAAGGAAAGRGGKWEKKKEKKRKNRLAGQEERGGKRRRGGGGSRSTRPGDYVEDWDDD